MILSIRTSKLIHIGTHSHGRAPLLHRFAQFVVLAPNAQSGWRLGYTHPMQRARQLGDGARIKVQLTRIQQHGHHIRSPLVSPS